MIDITIDNNEVSIEDKKFHSFNDRDNLIKLIAEILDKSRYSGESVSLHVVRYSPEDKRMMKFFIQEW